MDLSVYPERASVALQPIHGAHATYLLRHVVALATEHPRSSSAFQRRPRDRGLLSPRRTLNRITLPDGRIRIAAPTV